MLEGTAGYLDHSAKVNLGRKGCGDMLMNVIFHEEYLSPSLNAQVLRQAIFLVLV